MRTKNLFSCKNLPLIPLILMLALAACQQECPPVPESLVSHEILNEPGRIHNEMISYYYTFRSSGHGSNQQVIDEVFDLSWEYLAKKGCDADTLRKAIRAIDGEFRSSYMECISAGGYVPDSDYTLSLLSATGRFTPRFLTELSKILELGRLHDDRDMVRDYVNTEFQDIVFGNRQDNQARALFTDIVNGSYGFWELRDRSSLKGTDLERSSWVIINDGIGGVLGSIFGPIGTVVVATAFSVGTNEELNS